jgi:hypothetical protein
MKSAIRPQFVRADSLRTVRESLFARVRPSVRPYKWNERTDRQSQPKKESEP